MRYVFNYETLEGLDKALTTVAAGQKDSKTVLTLGTKDLDKLLVVTARVTTVAEEILMQATCDKPADWDKKPVTVAVKSDKLSGVIQSLCSFKEKIFISVEEAAIIVGVEGKAQVPVECLSEIPQGMKKGDTLMSFSVDGSAFAQFSKKGLLMTSEKPDQRGTQNAVISVNADTGEVKGVSTDNWRLAASTMTVKMPKAPEGNAAAAEKLKAINDALDAYCEKSGQKRDAFNINIPGETIRHLRLLTEGQKTFVVEVSEKNISVKLGNVAVYTAVQGATTPIQPDFVTKIAAQDGNATAQFDNEALIKAVDFVNQMNSLDGNEVKCSIQFDLTDSLFKASSGVTGQIATNVKVSAKSGSDVSINIRGKYLKSGLASLAKGNIVLKFLDKMLILQNGTVAEPDPSGIVCIMLVNKPKEEDSEEETAEEES